MKKPCKGTWGSAWARSTAFISSCSLTSSRRPSRAAWSLAPCVLDAHSLHLSKWVLVIGISSPDPKVAKAHLQGLGQGGVPNVSCHNYAFLWSNCQYTLTDTIIFDPCPVQGGGPGMDSNPLLQAKTLRFSGIK
jgi:hypothetical protein